MIVVCLLIYQGEAYRKRRKKVQGGEDKSKRMMTKGVTRKYRRFPNNMSKGAFRFLRGIKLTNPLARNKAEQSWTRRRRRR